MWLRLRSPCCCAPSHSQARHSLRRAWRDRPLRDGQRQGRDAVCPARSDADGPRPGPRSRSGACECRWRAAGSIGGATVLPKGAKLKRGGVSKGTRQGKVDGGARGGILPTFKPEPPRARRAARRLHITFTLPPPPPAPPPAAAARCRRPP